MLAPFVVCVFMVVNSSSVNAPGFFRMRSSIPIFPTSCSCAETRRIAMKSSGKSISLAILRVPAQLHDVGKIGIEDRILKKPGALTSEEVDIMKTHTSKGAHILRPVAQLKDMIPGIELHHESLDGRGYPHGLKGDDIPLLPRIIAVADTFDALTTNRPHQEARDPVSALRIIHNISGKRLDPAAVAAITAIYQRGEIRVPRPVLPLPPVPQPTPEIAASAAAAGVETSRF